jgi:hypothetical protein
MNLRAFTRYVEMLCGLHLDHHSLSIASFDEPSKSCLVCDRKEDLENVYSHRGGPLFGLKTTAQKEAPLRGVFVEVEQPDGDTSRELMMCNMCRQEHLSEFLEEGCAPSARLARAILLRHWRVDEFPCYRSMVP